MNVKKITVIFTVTIIALVIIYDLWAIQVGGKEASISNLIIDISYKQPSIVFASGFVCGHLFWRMKDFVVLGVKKALKKD